MLGQPPAGRHGSRRPAPGTLGRQAPVGRTACHMPWEASGWRPGAAAPTLAPTPLGRGRGGGAASSLPSLVQLFLATWPLADLTARINILKDRDCVRLRAYTSQQGRHSCAPPKCPSRLRAEWAPLPGRLCLQPPLKRTPWSPSNQPWQPCPGRPTAALPVQCRRTLVRPNLGRTGLKVRQLPLPVRPHNTGGQVPHPERVPPLKAVCHLHEEL